MTMLGMAGCTAAAVAMVRLERVVRVKVVVAQRWVGGAEARVVGVVQLAVVATLVVAGLALGAEELQQLEHHDRPPGNFCKVLGTKYHQIFRSFVFVVYSTFHSQCLFLFIFLASSYNCPAVVFINNVDSNIVIFF